MQEHPILFNTTMLEAILNGTKTQTRRPLKKQPSWPANAHMGKLLNGVIKAHDKEGILIPAPDIKSIFGQPGDYLWVRETYALIAQDLASDMAHTIHPEQPDLAAIYKAGNDNIDKNIRWHPSIHMPRWAGRIYLQIKEITIQRIQNIDAQAIAAEGIDGAFIKANQTRLKINSHNPYKAYQAVWNNTYKNWHNNPWVWVIEFTL